MQREIHVRVKTTADHFLHCERDLLKHLIEVDVSKAFEDFDFTHLTPYCTKYLGLSEPVAECLVRVVRTSHGVSELSDAVLSGRVSLYKAKSICSVITSDNVTEWLEKAETLTKKDLEKLVAESRGIQTRKTTLDLTIETREKLERARNLVSTKEKRFVSLEDAVDRTLDEYLYKHDPVERAHRSQKGSPKHEVNLRDEGQCQFIFADGSQCKEEKWVHLHHQVHRKDGGEDTAENLVSLCSAHPRMVHRKYPQSAKLH